MLLLPGGGGKMETSVLEVLEVCILLLWRGGQLARLMAAGGEHSQFVSGFGPVSRSGGCVWMRTATGQHLKCLTSPTPETSLATKESWNRPKASRLALPRRRPLSLSLSRLERGGPWLLKNGKRPPHEWVRLVGLALLEIPVPRKCGSDCGSGRRSRVGTGGGGSGTHSSWATRAVLAA